jgi:hypothetical protein
MANVVTVSPASQNANVTAGLTGAPLTVPTG